MRKTTHDHAAALSATWSVGTDIEHIPRFRKIGIAKLKTMRIFTARELAECSRKKDIYESLAARFAAKEAIIKALSECHIKAFYNQIEIRGRAGQNPTAKVKNYPRLKMSLSISHSKDYAMAFALLKD